MTNDKVQTGQASRSSPPDRASHARPWVDAAAILLLCALSLALYRQIALTNLILSGVDAMTYFYPYRAYAAQAIGSEQIPLWNPYLFLGVPFLANPQSGVFYPLNLALWWLSAPKLVSWSIVLHTAIAAVSAYLYARCVLRLSPLAAFLGASAFALGGYWSGQAGHVNQLNVLAWFPLLLLLWEERTRARWPALLALGAVIGLGLLAGHTQSTYISLVGLGVYALLPVFLPRSSPLLRALRDFVVYLWQLAVAMLLGLGLAAVQILPTLELSRLSIRSGGLSYREAVAFSLKPLPRLLRYTFLPPWASNLSAVYGGDFYTEFVAYVGLVPLLLAMLAAVLWPLHAMRSGLGSLHEIKARTTLQMIALAALGVFLALGLYNPLYLVLFKVVPGFGLFRVPARWLYLYAFGVAMLAGIGLQEVQRWLHTRRQPRLRPALDRAAALLLVAISLVGLFVAAQSLPLSHPTAPEAFSSLRTAPAHILAAQQKEAAQQEAEQSPTTAQQETLQLDIQECQTAAPGRFLSMSDILFDPGDLHEIQQMYQDQLSPRATYDYVVNVKRQEILAPNLPLAWGIYAVDGYDGGVLPLARYVHLQRLFLDEQDILSDGRLREGLTRIPPSRLLSILGARYVIADKVHDVWIDDVFYDLAFDTVLGPEGAQTVASDDLPRYAATGLGIVSHLEGTRALADGTPVAEVRLWTVDGELISTTLRAGMETAEGVYQGDVAHAQARFGRRWQQEAGETAIEGHDYVHQWHWGPAQEMARIEVEALPTSGRFHLRGTTLIDRRDASNVPLILSNDGQYRRVHSGDVKVYEALDTLPRAYAVHQTRILVDDEAALAAMADPSFDPAERAILAAGIELDPPPAREGTSHVTVERYTPHEVVLQSALDAPGYVVLSDSWYPGWQATVDGAPARIERANLNFRAVHVPAGAHTVRMAYRPTSYRVGLAISVAALLVALLSVILVAFSTNVIPSARRE